MSYELRFHTAPTATNHKEVVREAVYVFILCELGMVDAVAFTAWMAFHDYLDRGGTPEIVGIRLGLPVEKVWKMLYRSSGWKFIGNICAAIGSMPYLRVQNLELLGKEIEVETLARCINAGITDDEYFAAEDPVRHFTAGWNWDRWQERRIAQRFGYLLK